MFLNLSSCVWPSVTHVHSHTAAYTSTHLHTEDEIYFVGLQAVPESKAGKRLMNLCLTEITYINALSPYIFSLSDVLNFFCRLIIRSFEKKSNNKIKKKNKRKTSQRISCLQCGMSKPSVYYVWCLLVSCYVYAPVQKHSCRRGIRSDLTQISKLNSGTVG